MRQFQSENVRLNRFLLKYSNLTIYSRYFVIRHDVPRGGAHDGIGYWLF